MSAEQLDYAIRRGLGRAFLHARKHWRESDDQILIRRCLVDDRFDRQVEEPRSEWLYELIKITPNRSETLETVLFEMETGSGCSRNQALGIVLASWEDGETRFLDRLTKLVEAHPLDMDPDHVADIACATEPIVFQNWVSQLPRETIHKFIYSLNDSYHVVIKKHGRDALDPTNPAIRQIVDYDFGGGEVSGPTFDEVMDIINSEERVPDNVFPHRDLTEEHVAVVEAKLHEETKTSILKKLLYLLRYHGSVRITDRLIELTHHSDERLCWLACQILSLTTDERIGDRGREMADNGDRRTAGLHLLVQNHKPEDARRFEMVFDDAEDDDGRHGAMCAAIHAYEHTANDGLRNLLIRGYSEGSCMRCRFRILGAFGESKDVPTWMEAEASDNFS